MWSRLRPHSIYDVMAAIGCFAALATGTAYAANTIGSADIIDEAIVSADLKNYGVKRADIGLNSINGARIEDDSLTGADVDESTLGEVPSAGSAAVSGREVVNSELFQNPAEQQSYGDVECPAGKAATGGGVLGSNGAIRQSLNSTGPTLTGGWGAYVNNTELEDAASFHVFAVCVDVPEGAAAATQSAPKRSGTKGFPSTAGA